MEYEERLKREHTGHAHERREFNPHLDEHHDEEHDKLRAYYEHLDDELEHYDPSEYLPGHSMPDPYISHSFEDREAVFDHHDPYSFQNDYKNFDLFQKSDDVELENLDGTPLFLAAAANKYLDTTVTKFLNNDISVTKFLSQANDITVTKFLDDVVYHYLQQNNDITVTKFLD